MTLHQENAYHIHTEKIAEQFGVDAFCVVWNLSKEMLFSVLARYFETTPEILQQSKTFSDVVNAS